MTSTGPVSVGVDGSDEALHAVRWAADFANRHGRSLDVVHAWVWPFFNVPLGPPPGAPEDAGLRNLAERIVRDAFRTAREQCPTLHVTGRLVVGAPVAALRSASETASCVVIGSQGLGRVSGFLLGSVGVDLAGHARCPLVVVRGPARPDGPVLLGVDDSPLTAEAMELAFREAAARNAPLRAVHSWSLPGPLPDWPDSTTRLVDVEEEHAHRTLETLLAPLRERYPDVVVDCVTPPGRPAHNLVELSAGAQLAVVGTRGRGGFRGLLLGSTSQALMHHATCPVMVVPHSSELDDAANEDDHDHVSEGIPHPA